MSTDKPAGGGFSFGADGPDKQLASTGFSFEALSDSSSSKATTGFSFGAKSDTAEKTIGGALLLEPNPTVPTSQLVEASLLVPSLSAQRSHQLLLAVSHLDPSLSPTQELQRHHPPSLAVQSNPPPAQLPRTRTPPVASPLNTCRT